MSRPRKKRFNARKFYERETGTKIQSGLEVHHILPTRLGGTNTMDNLILLTLEEHKQAHMDLYEEHGDFRDLCAYYMIGRNFTEAMRIAASEGGKKAHSNALKKGKKSAFGERTAEERTRIASLGGKVGGKKQFELGIGIHAQTPEERRRLVIAAGIKARLLHNWSDPAKQADRGRRGGKKHSGSKGYTNDSGEYKRYSVSNQEIESFEDFINRTGFTIGNVKRRQKHERYTCTPNKFV